MRSKSIYLTIGALAVTMASCSNDYMESVTSAAKQNGLITATVEGNDAATRVGFNRDGSFYWSAGDEIGITTTDIDQNAAYNTQKFIPLSLVSGEGTNSAGFGNEGEMSSSTAVGRYAVYPYSDYTEISEGEPNYIYYNLPESYNESHPDTDFFDGEKSEKKSFKAPLLGEITTDDDGNSSVKFKHIGGVICIKIPRIPTSNGALILTTDNDHPITGTFSECFYYGFSAGSDSPQLNSQYVENGWGNTVTISYSDAAVGEPAVFYIPVPTGNYSTISVKLVDEAINPTMTYADVQRYNAEITRGMLYGIVLNEEDVSVTVSTMYGVNEALKMADNISVTLSLLNEAESVIVPAVTTREGSSKILNIKGSELSVPLTVITEGTEINSVENMTIKLPPSINCTGSSITMDYTTVHLKASAETSMVQELTTYVTQDTLIVGEGVTITILKMYGGYIHIKKGGKVEVLQNGYGYDHPVFVTIDEGGTLSYAGDYVYDLSNITTYTALAKVMEYNGRLSVKLADDIEVEGTLYVSGTKELDFNGHKISLKQGCNVPDLISAENADLTLKGESGGLYITDESCGYGVYASSGSNLTISGGITIQGNCYCVLVGGYADIRGGIYRQVVYPYAYSLTLSTEASGGNIRVTGGTFYGYDPAHDGFVPSGYSSKVTGTFVGGDDDSGSGEETLNIYTVSLAASTDNGEDE